MPPQGAHRPYHAKRKNEPTIIAAVILTNAKDDMPKNLGASTPLRNEMPRKRKANVVWSEIVVQYAIGDGYGPSAAWIDGLMTNVMPKRG